MLTDKWKQVIGYYIIIKDVAPPKISKNKIMTNILNLTLEKKWAMKNIFLNHQKKGKNPLKNVDYVYPKILH